MKPTVELVCFDLGRVLVKLVDGWEHACECAGVASPASFKFECLLPAINAHESGQIDHAEFVARCCTLGGLKPEGVAGTFDAWIRGVYDGVGELIDEVRSRGVKTACLSNTSDRHWQRFLNDEEYAALRKLDHLFASHLVGVMKPKEAIFRYVEREVGVLPGGILFFDDAAGNVEGARKAGWQVELIDQTRDPIEQMRGHLKSRGVL
jgi:glucose-1-phosphatase